MIIAIPKERKEREKRVALTPNVVKALVAAGYECRMEKDAGLSSYFANEEYTAAGATLVDQAQTLYSQADVVLKVNAPIPEEIGWMKKEAVLISLLFAATNPSVVEACARQGITAFSMDAIPRISRAQ